MRPIKGLHTDYRPIGQPPDTTRFVLNGIDDGFDGNLGSNSTEPGNELCFSTGVDAVGTLTMADDEVIIFSVATDDSYSEIGLAKGCHYTPLVKSDCLGFSREYPIKGVYRVKDCDRLIYFYDGFNPDRVLNLDQLEDFLIEGETLLSTSLDKWDCEKFNLNFSYITPSVEYNVLEFGSQLAEGSYALAFAYEDSEGNQTDYFSFTTPIPIQQGNSIEVSVVGLDTSFEYLRPAVISFTADDGATTSVYELQTQAITSPNLTFVVNSITSGVTTILSDINIPGSKFISSEAMEIVNNRLVRANLRERDVDWSAFQRAAVNASVRWVAKAEQITFSDQQLEIEQKSLRRDEVYSIGLVYVFNDGLESPVFHIPGRAANNASYLTAGNTTPHWRSQTAGPWDTAAQTVVATPTPILATAPGTDEIYDQDVVHLNLQTGDTVERWRVYNTALVDEPLNDTRGYWAMSGEMGYHESNETYPITANCNGDKAFGDLAGTPIRYHRMPDLTIAPVHRYFYETFLPPALTQKDWIFHLGLELDNVTIPADYQDQVVGYRVVYSRIDNPTVLDTGILERTDGNYHPNSDTFLSQAVPFHNSKYDSSVFNGYANSPLEVYGFHSPDAKMNGGLPDTGYTVTQTRLRGTIDERYNGAAPSAPDFGERRYSTILKGYSIFTTPSIRTVFDQGRVGINTISNFKGYPFINAGMQEYDYLDIEYDHFYLSTILYTPNLVGDGDPVDYPLTNLKRSITPHPSISSITYVQFNAQLYTDTSLELYGGDTYLTDFTFRKTQREVDADESSLDEDIKWYDVTAVIRFISESRVNANLREEADSNIFIASDGTQQQGGIFYPGSLTLDNFLKREPEYPNYYYTNRDFWVTNFYKEHRSLSYGYDYCEGCNIHPNLLAYSEESFDTDIFDNFRKFRVNNLATIPGSRGEITNLAFFRKNLLVFTKESLFQLVPNPQKVISDVGAIYLGTAEFLSIPSNEIIQAEHGHAGTSGRFNIKKTPYGIFYVDIEQGKVYKFYDGLDDISARGMHNYFQERRGYELNKQFNETFNTDYRVLDNTILDNGIGTIGVYDPRYERYIITKKDYASLEEVDKVYVCIPYLDLIDGQSVRRDWTCEVYCFQTDTGGVTNPVGLPYDFYVDFNNSSAYDLNVSSYARAFRYSAHGVYLIGNPPGFLKSIVNFTSVSDCRVTYVDENMSFNELVLEPIAGTYKWNSEGKEIGEPTGHRPYIKLKELDAFNPNGTIYGTIYNDPDFGFYYQVTPQVDPNENYAVYFEMSTNAPFVANSDNGDVADVQCSTGVVHENFVKNPITGKVVQYQVQRSFGIDVSDSSITLAKGVIPPQARQQVIGFNAPESDTWTIDFAGTYIYGQTRTTPNVYVLINETDVYPTNISVATQSGFNAANISFTQDISLNQGDTVDIIIDNTDSGSGTLFPLDNNSRPLSATSTTDTVREICFFTTPSEVYEQEIYDGFNVIGYPQSQVVAADKELNLDQPSHQIAEVHTAASTTYTAAGSPYTLPGGSLANNGGIYEILEEQSPLKFLDVALGAANYTINVYNDETDDLIGNFVYNTAASTANGYDTFYYVPTGTFSHIRKTDNSRLIRTELTVAGDTTSEIEHDEGFKFYRMTDAKSEIRSSACDEFLIQEHDALTATTGSSFSLDVGTIERALVYFTIDIDGIYDVYFDLDVNITDPDFEFKVYINQVQAAPLQGSITDPDKLYAFMKDVDLNKGDEIMLTVKNVNSSEDADSGQWLTALVKKDYECVEALPKSNRSHTLSYDVKNDHWTSFHSYLPKLYYNDSQTFYGTQDLQNWYKHVDRNFNTYYDTKYPYIIEFVVNDVNTTILNSLQWVGKVESYDEVNKEWIEVDDTTYNKFVVYNSKQSTGTQELDFEESPINWSNVTKRVIKSDHNYRVGGIRNIATGQPVNTSDWDEIENTFNTYGYIDKIPLSSSINYNISMADLSPLRDKYHVVRLIYDGDELYRISLDVTGTQQQYSRL